MSVWEGGKRGRETEVGGRRLPRRIAAAEKSRPWCGCMIVIAKIVAIEDPEAEKQLQQKLEEVFMEIFGNRNYTKWHNKVSCRDVTIGVGNTQGMG